MEAHKYLQTRELLGCVVHSCNTSIKKKGLLEECPIYTLNTPPRIRALSLFLGPTGSRHTCEIMPEPLGSRRETSFTSFSPTSYSGFEDSSCGLLYRGACVVSAFKNRPCSMISGLKMLHFCSISVLLLVFAVSVW